MVVQGSKSSYIVCTQQQKHSTRAEKGGERVYACGAVRRCASVCNSPVLRRSASLCAAAVPTDIKIRHLRDIDQIDHREVFDILRQTEQHLILTHARLVVVVAETNHHHTILFAEDGLHREHTESRAKQSKG